MRTTSRREVILSAAVAGAALGLDRSLAIAAPTRVQQMPDPPRGFFRYKVGDAECTAVYDGIWEKVHDQKFIANASIAEVKQALAAAGLTTAFVPIQITAFVIKLNGKLVLCDTGGGDQVQAFNPLSIFVSGKLIANMRAAGIDPKKIDTVLISHFHPDHIFGLLDKNTKAPMFPNAEILVPAAEYNWWTDPSLIMRLPEERRPIAQRIQSMIPHWKNAFLIDGENEVVPGIRFVNAPGHTAGHTAFHISSGQEQLLISSDAAYVPALNAAHPDWHGAYDQNAAVAEATRRKLLDRVIADNMMICGSHFPWPGLGKIVKDGAGYTLERTPVVADHVQRVGKRDQNEALFREFLEWQKARAGITW